LTGFSRLLEPPRLRTARRGIQDDRRATRLELFLIFAGVLVPQVVYELARHEAHAV
jgi:hypothetical protein